MKILCVNLDASQKCLGNIKSFQLGDKIFGTYLADCLLIPKISEKTEWTKRELSYLLYNKMSVIQNDINLFISG